MNGQDTGPFGRAHPVLLIGIFVFILPYLKHWKVFSWAPSWLSGIGVVMILVGAVLSVYNLSKG